MALLFLLFIFLLAFLFCFVVGSSYRFLLGPILVAFLVRVIFLFLAFFGVFTLPGQNDDALVFSRMALAWSQLDWDELIGTFDTGRSYIYSSLGAVVYKVFGYHELILPSINMLFGVVSAFIVAVIALRLWGKRPAVIAGYLMALYPFAVFNSAVSLREEMSIFLFLVGLYIFLKWVSGKNGLYLVFSIFTFGLASIIHPGWIGALLGVSVYLFYNFTSLFIFLIKKGGGAAGSIKKMSVSLAFFLFSFAFLLGSSGGITLPKGIEVGGGGGTDFEVLIESRFSGEATGGSAYPGFIAQGNPYTQPWLIPARIVYFHFSPFPWDIRSPRHLLGLVSSLMYIFLAWRVYRGWDRLKSRDECVAMLFIFGAITFVFAIGVTNIGTAIRHKTKLFALFVILAASSFHSLKKIKFGRG